MQFILNRRPKLIAGIIPFGLVILLLLSASFSNASTGTAVSGSWNSASTWIIGGVSRVPTCGDTLIIPQQVIVTIDATMDFSNCTRPLCIIVNGKIDINNGYSLLLPCNSVVQVNTGGAIKRTGGGHNITTIEICSTVVYSGDNGILHGTAYLFVPNLLPVSLIYFNPEVMKDEIKFNWATNSEINNESFTIEKSLNGNDFTEVDKIKGSGTTSELTEYYGYDYNPVNGKIYYRLKQTDFDGKSIYSEKVAVLFSFKRGLDFTSCSFEQNSIKIYFISDINDELYLSIINISGIKIHEEKIVPVTGLNEIQISSFDWNAGIYIITLSNSFQFIKYRFLLPNKEGD